MNEGSKVEEGGLYVYVCGREGKGKGDKVRAGVLYGGGERCR